MASDEHTIIPFAERVIVLLDQGGFTATYKYAVLLGLMDLCFERGARAGDPPSMVTTAELAEKIVDHFVPWARHPDDGIDNLVVSHSNCNRDKSDFLADAGHLESWVSRIERHGKSLRQIAADVRWQQNATRTASVLRSIYQRLPAGVRVWHLEREFVALDRERVTSALATLGNVAA